MWSKARVELSGLLKDFGKNKYQSNNCSIKSLFEHPKEKVNLGKRKVMQDLKEELTDIVSEKMTQLHLSAKQQTFTEHQRI